MALPSIKSLIVNALTGKTSIDRVHNEYFLEQYVNTKHPKNLRGVPRWTVPVAEFVEGLKRLGVTDLEAKEWEGNWQELVHSCEKRAKLRSMNEVSIETLVKAKLKGTGIKYMMKKQQYRVVLTLTMAHNTQGTFYIQHSKFKEQLDKIVPTVIQLNELMDDLGQAIRVRVFEKNADWQECD